MEGENLMRKIGMGILWICTYYLVFSYIVIGYSMIPKNSVFGVLNILLGLVISTMVISWYYNWQIFDSQCWFLVGVGISSGVVGLLMWSINFDTPKLIFSIAGFGSILLGIYVKRRQIVTI